ncbi:unnamed protein product [Brassica oleracea]
MDNIDHLLRRVATPRKKKTPSTLKNMKGKRVTPGRRVAVPSEVIKEDPVKMSVGESKLRTLRSQLDLFDKAWCAFLNSFVLWKVKDARLLGEDKVRAACQFEISMIQKCKITPEGDDSSLMTRRQFRPEIRKALLSFPEGYTNFTLL